MDSNFNFAHVGDFAGTILNHAIEFLPTGTWIIDTGTFNHMCIDLHLIVTLISLNENLLFLPDGSFKMIHHIGNAI